VSYLIAHQLPAVGIKNAAGKYEYPNLNNIENAAQTVKRVPGSNALHIVDPSKKAKIAYPISTFTYVIAPTTAPNAYELKKFIKFAINDNKGAGLDFAPLPKVVKRAAIAAANSL